MLAWLQPYMAFLHPRTAALPAPASMDVHMHGYAASTSKHGCSHTWLPSQLHPYMAVQPASKEPLSRKMHPAYTRQGADEISRTREALKMHSSLCVAWM